MEQLLLDLCDDLVDPLGDEVDFSLAELAPLL